MEIIISTGNFGILYENILCCHVCRNEVIIEWYRRAFTTLHENTHCIPVVHVLYGFLHFAPLGLPMPGAIVRSLDAM